MTKQSPVPLSPPLPILLAESVTSSDRLIELSRQQGQLVDLSGVLDTTKLTRNGDELHIHQSNDQFILIHRFFGRPSNEVFILLGTGPLATQGQFLATVQIADLSNLDSFPPASLLSGPQSNEETDNPTDDIPLPETTQIQLSAQKFNFEDLALSRRTNELSKEPQEEYYPPLRKSPFTLVNEALTVPTLLHLYVQPDTMVTRESNVPIPTIEEALLRTSDTISISESLEIDFGSDGADSRALLFTLDAAGRPLGRSGYPLELTSGSARVLFQSSFGPEGEHILTGIKSDGTLVLKLILDAASPNGTYTYQQYADLDHAANSHNLLLSFRFRAKDADGDTLISYLDIRVQDDQLPATLGTGGDRFRKWLARWNTARAIQHIIFRNASDQLQLSVTLAGVEPTRSARRFHLSDKAF